MCVMKTVPIMRAQHNLAGVLRTIRPGGRVAITRNKRVVAEIVVPAPLAPQEFPDFETRARNTWGGPWQGASSDALLDDARGNR